MSEALASGHGDRPGKIVRTMILLQEAGFPPRGKRLNYDPADDLNPRIYRLKGNPTCWRLYFHDDHRQYRIIYLHAVCKKTNKRDPSDSSQARRLFEAFREGRVRIDRFPFPAG